MNLRTTPALRFGHYTAQLLNPELEIGFIAACNPRLKLLVVYAFRRADFPWVGNWEERYNRTQAPWLGKTFCRGLEFSTTPFAIPRRETIEQGPLFGESTYRWLPAKSKAQVRFLILLFEVPETFRGVAQCFHCQEERSMLSSPELVAGSFQSRPTNFCEQRRAIDDVSRRSGSTMSFAVKQQESKTHHESACHRYRFESDAKRWCLR